MKQQGSRAPLPDFVAKLSRLLFLCSDSANLEYRYTLTDLMGLHLYMLFSLPSPVLTAMAHESTHRERFHPGIIKDIQNMIGCWRICEEVFVSADSFLLLIRDGAIFAAGCAVASYKKSPVSIPSTCAATCAAICEQRKALQA